MNSLLSYGFSFRPAFFIVVFIVQSFASLAQVTVVKDINTKPSSLREENDYTKAFCECNNKLYFAVDNELGNELWVTDGTSEGSHVVKDIYKGSQSGLVQYPEFKCYKDLLYFMIDDGNSGFEPWVTNGTSEGTMLLEDLIPGTEGSYPTGYVEFKNKLVFIAQGGAVQNLWQTGGTADDLTLLQTFPTTWAVWSITASSNYLYLDIRDRNRGDNVHQFIRTDGTAAGTVTLTDVPGPVASIKVIDDKVFFSKYNPSYKDQLWVADETQRTMIQLGEFYLGYTFLAFNDKLVFQADNSTWISDGTESGTKQISDLVLNAGVSYNNLFYGVGYDYSNGSYGFFKTNGTADGTEFLLDLKGSNSEMNIFDIPLLNGHFILPSVIDAAMGEEPTITDGTPEGTHVLKDIFAGPARSWPRDWQIFNNLLYFIADDGIHGSEIWVTNGTEAGTSLFKDIVAGTDDSVIGSLFTFKGQPYFSGGLDYSFSTLFKIDKNQQAQPVQELTDVPQRLGELDQHLILFSDRKIIQSGDLTAELSTIKDYTGLINGYGVRPGTVLNDKLIFEMSTSAGTIKLGREFGVTDRTEEGTHVLKDINPGLANGIRYSTGAVISSHFIFGANDGTNGNELWTTDGTESGTVLLKDINAAGSSDPSGLIALHTIAFFAADDGIHGKELWKTDGTSAGTVLVKDIYPGNNGSTPEQLVRLNDELLFIAHGDEDRGWALWKTDGTESGTVFIKEISSGSSADFNPAKLTVTGNLLFFSARDDAHGTELWISDGTTDGTFIMDLVPGAESSNPSLFTDANGITYFTANAQLWGSDGTKTGTSKIADVAPFEMIYHQNWLYFSANTAEHGYEVYKLPITRLNQLIDFPPVLTKVMGTVPFDLIATATSLTPVIFSTGSEKISISNATATLLQPGSVTIHADQPGNVFYNPASRVDQTFCINPAQPVITSTADVTGAALLTSSAETGNEWFLNGAVITDATAKTFQASESGVYTVQVSIDECKSEVSADLAVIVTAADDNDGRITLSPNPVSNTLRIQSIGTEENSIIKIYSVSGQPMERFTLQSSAIIDHNVQGYAKGLYIVKISSAKGVSFSKFVKE